MKQITGIQRMQKHCTGLKVQGEKIGFVPTMGYLHEGHLSLVKRSKKECSITAASIFVNPAQFAPHEDFDRYPRNINRDIKLLRKLDIDILFTPKTGEIYPEPFLTSILVDEITTIGEGVSRSRHFQGVNTIVAKLLNIVQPSVLYLGQKDIQQAVILKKMIQDLNMPTAVKLCPTIREKNGLAMSSRNIYLSPKGRKSAAALITALRAAKKMIKSGERDCKKITKKMEAAFDRFPEAKIDYILCADFESFKPVFVFERRAIIAIAAYVGNVRLIDNVILSPQGK